MDVLLCTYIFNDDDDAPAHTGPYSYSVSIGTTGGPELFNVDIILTSFDHHGSSNTTFPAEHDHMLNRSWTNGQRLLASVADTVTDIGGLRTVVSSALGFQVNIH